MKLKNKTIVITGASDWIGEQIALKLAKKGVKLALIWRSNEKLKEVGKKALKLGAIDIKIYTCDIRQIDKLETTIKTIISDFNSVDILINNAWIWQKLNPLEKIEKNIINEVIETNLTALIQTTRLLLPILKNKKKSAIINIVSKSGVLAQEWQSVYTASKYWVRWFTEVLKVDLKWSNIKVAWVYQSGTNTNMFKKTWENFSTEKFTNPKDLADIIVYMLSLPEKIWLHDVRIEF